jgi:hypothetical protein
MRDYEIRVILKRTELAQHISDPLTKIVEELELPAASARIDLAVINGTMTGYEIKSSLDNLKRLPNQLEAYRKIFDFISVVTASKHVEKIISEIPDSIGVLLVDENLPETIRNYEIQPFYLLMLLRREEVINLAKKLEIKIKMQDRNWIICEKLSNSIGVDIISENVRFILKTREQWKVARQ